MSHRPGALYPHVFVDGADAAAAFYRDALGAVELFRNALPDGTLLLIELAVGDGRLLLSDEVRSLGALAPPTVGGTPMLLTLEVDDVDGLTAQAVAAGAAVEMPVQEMYFGERYGIIRDPFGHRWAICTRREALSPDEIQERTPPSV
ncbi:MAG: VOC family protein [Candidatus Dormiibacterota bacterium]